jgi:uncharacterized membrane protein (DUF373 family)
MKTILTLLQFLFKIVLICVYMVTRGLELFLEAFNNAFKQLLGK